MSPVLAVCTVLWFGCGSDGGPDAPSPVEQQVARAAAEFGVPADLLKAHAWSVSRYRLSTDTEGHGHAVPGHGVMALMDGSTLPAAAQLLGVSPDRLITDLETNTRGGAALLRQYYDESGNWWTAVGRLSGADDANVQWQHAAQVYRVRTSGAAEATVGVRELPARFWSAALGGDLAKVIGVVGSPPTAWIGNADYEPAFWAAAHSSNYTSSNRPTSYPVEYIVIHTVQGSYAGAISWFQNSSSNVSAHYVVRSSDGEVTQMVKEKDWAWHAGNGTYNRRSVGIEHEGFVDDASWYTEAMYTSSASLSRYLVDKWSIPITRSNIIGHVEVPNATHTDPGVNWDWDHYMALIADLEPAGARLVGFVREDDIFDGAGIPGATVVLESGETTTTNADGYYELTGLAPNLYTVSVTAPGFEGASSSKDVTAGTGVFWKSVALSASQVGVGEPELRPADALARTHESDEAPGCSPRW